MHERRAQSNGETFLRQDLLRRQRLQAVFSPSFEEVHNHPTYLENLLNLFSSPEQEENVIQLGNALNQRDDLLHSNDAILIACKSYDGLKVLDERNVTKAYGVGADHSKDVGGISAVTLDTSLLAKNMIDADDLRANAVAGKDLKGPRDWILADTTLYVAAHDGIAAIDLQADDMRMIHSQFLRSPHSVVQTPENQLCLTSSGADMILFYDPIGARMTRQISAWDLGIQTALGKQDRNKNPLRRINTFEDQELSQYLQSLRNKHGFEVVLFSRDHPFTEEGLTTSEQSVHFNSAIVHPDGRTVLTSVFATSQFDEETGERIEPEGTGGKVLAISEENETREVVTGLSNPHKLVFVGQRNGKNYFMLTNSGQGQLRLYEEEQDKPLDWSLVGTLDFEGLPEQKFRKTSWLQTITPTISADGNKTYLSGFDSSRRGIYVIDLQDKSYQFIRTGDDTVVHQATYIPAS